MIRARRGDLGLFALSASAGLSSYVFSLLLDRMYGPLVLAHVLRLISATSAVTLPSAVVLLPIAAWAAHAPDLRRRLGRLQVGALLLGGASVGLFAVVDQHVPAAWLPGLALLTAFASYPLYLGSGVLCGRGAFIAFGAVAAVPTVGRLLALLGVLALHGTVVQVVWGVGVAALAAGVLATVAAHAVRDAGAVATPAAPGATWASALVALAVTAWLQSDIVFGSLRLAPQAASLFAVIALLGKTPYWLAQPLATKAIAQESLGRARGTTMAWEIYAIGGASLLGGVVLGARVLGLMQVPASGLLPLLAYFVGATLLARAYVGAGAAAQHGRHQWWPLLATFAIYALLAALWPTGVLGLALRFALGITLALALQEALERRVGAVPAGGAQRTATP